MQSHTLVGKWETNSYGAMEREEIAFCADGTGWWLFENSAGGERLTFRWVEESATVLLLEFNERVAYDATTQNLTEEISAEETFRAHFQWQTAQWHAQPNPHSVLHLSPWLTGGAIEYIRLPQTPDDIPRFPPELTNPK